MRSLGFGSTALVLVGALLLIDASPAAAQFGLGDRVRNAVEREVGNQVDRIATDAVRCAMGDERCAQEARDNGQTPVFEDGDGNVITDADGQPITDAQAAATAAGGGAPSAPNADAAGGTSISGGGGTPIGGAGGGTPIGGGAADASVATATGEAPGQGVWRNYDFVPGNEVWYAMDLANAQIGRIPVDQLEFIEGNMQVVELDGIRTLEFSSETWFRIPLPDELPDDFTVELEFQAAAPNIGLTLAVGRNESARPAGFTNHYINLWRGAGIYSQANAVSNTDDLWEVAEYPVSFKLQVDGSPDQPDYVILYGGETRVAQVPNADFGRANELEIRVAANGSRPAYLRNVVVAVHGEPLNDALATTGEFVTRGIMFDVDSDRIRGESTPTLSEILASLERNADMAVTIEGHTDGQGADDYNLDLSQRRAESVVAYLVGNGIDANRLTAVGRGESEPIADNGTEVGRQQNRRVVIRAQ
jgi:OmpA-OmpF porin, OOP family